MTVNVSYAPMPVEEITAENGQGRTLRVSKTDPNGAKVKLQIINGRGDEVGVVRLPVAEFSDLLDALNENADYLTRVCR